MGRDSVGCIDPRAPKNHRRMTAPGARWRLGGALAGVVGLAGLLGACGGSGSPPASTTTVTSAPSTTVATTTTSTVPVKPATGVVTVLSPIGLNVRSGPSKAAPKIGSAAQGAVLQVLARTTHAGGWFKVRGATVTGWITVDPAYSAPGRFGTYNSPAFSVLFPAGWTYAGTPGSGVSFRAPAPSVEKVVMTTAPAVGKLPSVHQGAGVAQNGSRQVIACGVTSYLITYITATPGRYLADAGFRLDAHHALGVKATLTSLTQVRTVLDFVNSVSFPLPVCVGGPPPTPKPAAQAKAPSSAATATTSGTAHATKTVPKTVPSAHPAGTTTTLG